MDTVEPRTLNRFQQLNSVKLGVTTRTIDAALAFMEAEAEEVLPNGFVVDYTGESRQLREEGGNKAFLQTFVLAVVMCFLVLAAQFNLPRSVYHPYLAWCRLRSSALRCLPF